ncbi:MAG: MBL fold metallo-hydrolase, partial [Bacteroidota bacterium]
KIQKTLSTLIDRPITYLFNTHMHGDHSGGNINFNGSETTLIAQDKVRDRLVINGTKQVEEGKMTAEDYKKLLPEITYTDQMTFFEADEKVLAFHVHDAHTDGDTMIYFVNENVLHMGDTYFAGNYPFIDLNSGGSVDGYIAAHEKAQLVIDDNTQIIPGHGLLSNKTELKGYTDMLRDLRSIMQKEIDAGKTLEEVKANTDLFGKYDAKYGTWFIKPERMRETVYLSLTAGK